MPWCDCSQQTNLPDRTDGRFQTLPPTQLQSSLPGRAFLNGRGLGLRFGRFVQGIPNHTSRVMHIRLWRVIFFGVRHHPRPNLGVLDQVQIGNAVALKIVADKVSTGHISRNQTSVGEAVAD